MRRIMFFFVAVSIASLADDAGDIKALLLKQVSEWNRGDVEKFVDYYSDNCVFVGREVRRGRSDVLARYRKTYPDKAAMGTTTFSELEVEMLGRDAAKVLGRWRLDRSAQAGGATGGYFTLILRREKAGWKITHDHTSTMP